MPANLYGFNDNFNLETSHVLPALIRKCHLAKLLKNNDFEKIKRDFQRRPLGFELDNEAILENKQTIKNGLKKLGITEDYVMLWGTGELYREFLYVDDLADACVLLMENYDYKDIGELINIGTGEDIKVKALARLIKEIAGFEGEIKHDLAKPDGTQRRLLDVSKAREVGWEAKIKIEEGIKKTYDWYCNVQ
jgi:GDP-L-fucose synthase